MDKAGEAMQWFKNYYEKMVDFKCYGIVLLCASIFLYLGVVIPAVAESQTELTWMMSGSLVFLAGSSFFFLLSKSYRHKLLETEEGQEYLQQRENVL
jgi:hypothetical protein